MRKTLLCLLVLSGCRQAEAPIDTLSVTPPNESTESTTEGGASIEKGIGLDAEEVFASALATASNEGKNVFVHLGGPGWGWCTRLEEFLDTNNELISKNYTLVKIDRSAMANGKEVSDRLRKGRSGGIPWIVILDPEGNELATSDGPQGNIGCPVKPDEVGHFMTMVEKSNKTYSPSEVQQLASALEIFAKKFRRN